MLRPDEDAFGRALLACLDGREGHRLLLERDDGWVGEAMAPALFFADVDEWPSYERAALAEVPANARVLDVGCGAGRHALHLEQRGHSVVAVDHSPGAVEVSRRRGVADVRLTDIWSLPDGEPYEAVILMCGNLGIGGSPADSHRFLHRLRAMVRPGAVLIGDTVDVTYGEQAPEHHAYHEQNRRSGRPPGLVRLRSRYGATVTPWFALYNVARHELPDLVAETGWRLRTRFDQGSDYAAVLVAE